MRLRSLALATYLACTALPALAEPADIAPAVAAPDRTKEDRLLDTARRPVDILQFMGLERGDRALDVFGNTAYYGTIMARAVGPQGSVDAWGPSVSKVWRRKWGEIQRRIPNLKLLVSPAPKIQLPVNKYDFVMFNLNYHDLYWESAEYLFPRIDPPAFMAVLYRSMKPGAVLAIIDHAGNPGGNTREVVEKLHRIDPAKLRADLKQAGFVLDAESTLLANPADDHLKNVYDRSIRFRTDQIVYRFRKPG